MSRLPVIVAAGGVNAAGRISGHHAYRRIVFDALSAPLQQQTLESLAALMRIDTDAGALTPAQRDYILAHSLVRRIEPGCFDVDHIAIKQPFAFYTEADGSVEIKINKKDLPASIPASWSVTELDENTIAIQMPEPLRCMLDQTKVAKAQAAGQLPTGCNPSALYQSRNHPKGLALSIYAASDALGDLGIDWNHIKQLVSPNDISAYGGSALGQLDQNSYGGLFRAHPNGKRVTPKQLPLSLSEMPIDFVNAYVLGNFGATGCNTGACASFLYSLKLAMEDIRSGQRRISVVGNAEAPLVPEVMEGFSAMGALAEYEMLMAMDQANEPDHRRSCRPFGNNCGFTLAESGVFVVLMDDQLALDIGARILGGVGSVHINADGFKRSISGPGVGNYTTLGLAMATARKILGETGLQQHTYVQAHGTGTPQNRITESQIINEMAAVFGVEDWLVSAIKAHIGHSMAPASGDQLAVSLGVWQEGIVPGITTIDAIAEDVYTEHVRYPLQHEKVAPEHFQAVFINSKGFGGNNATGLVLSPKTVETMLITKHGRKAWQHYQTKLEVVQAKSAAYDRATTAGRTSPIYEFGANVLEGKDLQINDQEIRIPGFKHSIDLGVDNPYPDMS